MEDFKILSLKCWTLDSPDSGQDDGDGDGGGGGGGDGDGDDKDCVKAFVRVVIQRCMRPLINGMLEVYL